MTHAGVCSYARGMTTLVERWSEAREHRSELADAALGIGLAALFVVGTYFASHTERAPHRPFDVWAIALVVLAALAVGFRRRAPVAVLLVVFAVTLGYFVLGYANGPIWIALIVAYFTAILAGHRLVTAIVAVTGFAIFPWLDYLLRERPAPSWVGLAGLAAWLLVVFGVAEGVRIRRERTAEAIRMREEEALRRAGEERLRIAQELHDALGHHLSLINVQAGVALHLNAEMPDEIRRSLSAIKEASKEGLSELRSVLEILRQDDERAPRSPTSTLGRVEDLVAQARSAGLDVRLTVHGDERPLPFGVDVAAYRIVQEALTNVTRHAGRASATVRIAYGARDLVVDVEDDGRGRTDRVDGSGKGIVGMRERAAALGGDVDAGPRPGGGFRVHARLPVEEPR